MLEAFEQRTVVVETLAGEVTSLVGEVRGLRKAVAHRPPRREIERKRRLAALAVAVWSLLLIFAHDQHVEMCGPGARTEQVVDRFLDGETDPKALREAAQPEAPYLCDAFFPFHGHGDESAPPNSAHTVGVVGYIVVIAGATLWAVRPTRRTRDDETVEDAEVDAALKGKPGK